MTHPYIAEVTSAYGVTELSLSLSLSLARARALCIGSIMYYRLDAIRDSVPKMSGSYYTSAFNRTHDWQATRRAHGEVCVHP